MLPLPLYSVWPYTPVIPAFYWNAKSTEEIIKYLACENEHITAYLDYITNKINTALTDYDNRLTQMQSTIATYTKIVDDLQNILENIGDGMLVYDPTKGTYVDSKIAMRDMYRELAVFGARVSQIATLTVEQSAKHSTLETADIGNKTIFGNNEPRVTPTEGSSS